MDLNPKDLNDLLEHYDKIVFEKDPVCINDVLPKEIILKIFSYLDIVTLARISSVCRYWHECAFDGSIWKEINLVNFHGANNPKLISKIAEHSHGFLRSLNLKGCRCITDEAIKILTESCHHIEILDLSHCHSISNNACRYISQNCKRLKVISLESTSFIDNFGLSLLNLCHDLISLDLSWTKLTDQNLIHIADGCRRLERVRCVGCQFLTSHSIIYLAKYCSRLKSLNLNYCQNNITDHALMYLAIYCRDLKILCLSYCSITDVGLRALAGCLNISMVPSLLTYTLPAEDLLIRYNLINQTHNANNPIRGQILPLHHPTMPRNSSLVSRSRLIRQNQSNHLFQSPNGQTFSGERQSFLGFGDFSFGCFSLKTVELSHCFSISDNGVIALIRSSQKLERLDVENCCLITDLTLAQIGLNCPRLKTLIISNCDQITDDGISKLTSGLNEREHLINLAMDNCPLLTDVSLDYLSKKINKLKRLDLFDCQLITKQGILKLQDLSPTTQVQAYFAPEVQNYRSRFNFHRIFKCCNLL